jgi:hypothetical protein
MDKIAVDETEKRIPLGNNSVLIVQNISSTPLEWSHEPRTGSAVVTAGTVSVAPKLWDTT